MVLGAGAETDASGVLGSETAARTRTARAARADVARARDTGATPVAKEEAAAALAIVLGLRVSVPKDVSSWRVRSLGSPGARG